MLRQITASQEAASKSLEKAAECLQALAVTLATHDQRAVIMYDQCGDHGAEICGIKDILNENQRDIKETLALNQKEIMLAVTRGQNNDR